MAQKEKDEKGYITSAVTDTMMSASAFKDEFIFDFPNINNVDFYYSHSKLQNILKHKKSGDKEKLKEALEDYVQNFGIRNFSEETDLIWLLAQLYEELGEWRKAKAAYHLVLKHHKRIAYPQVKKYLQIFEKYDIATELERDDYVPLEYYYELVEYRKFVDTLIPPKSVLTNMGESVNQRNLADYGPSISMNDKLLIFTKKTTNKVSLGTNKGASLHSENLYFCQGYDDGWWDEAQKFPEPVNSRCNEGSACISNDGNTIFFARCRIEQELLDCSDCIGSCDIYTSTKKNDKWSKPENLGKHVNTIAWESHPSLSVSEDTLFFASNRPGGFGLSDIWFTHRNSRGKWSKAENMGPVINTIGNEFSPYASKTDPVFYFSSNGQVLNFGDIDNKKVDRTLDIYKVHERDGKWLEPKNIGPLVNGAEDEYYFTIDSKSEKLYYARTEEHSKDKLQTDLFSFPVPMGAQPTATVRLKGTLTDKETGVPYEGIVSIIDLESGIEVAPKEVESDGTFSFDLINHQKYLLIVQGDEFFRIEKLFELRGDTTIENKATSVRNRKLQFTTIVFENGKWDILESMHQDLWNVINFLIDNPGFNLKIGGHTDSDGNPDANQKLSQKRAEAIKKFVVKNGDIRPDRITAIGYGSLKPIKYPEVTEADKQINRRVEFEITHHTSDDDPAIKDGSK